MKRLCFPWLLASLSLTSPALAEPTRQDEVTVYAFEDTLVGGDHYQPNLEVLTVKKGRRGDSLVQVRESFIRELLKSVEQL